MRTNAEQRSRPPGPAIHTSGLIKEYGRARALDGFSLEVAAGTVHGLLGPNGAGKSTAVNLLTTLVDIDDGQAEVAGLDVRTQAAAVRRHIGLVGQQTAVDDVLGGRQNLVMFGRLFGLSRAAARTRADELLESFGLTDAAGRPASTYSGGMRRRLDIAAGMIIDPTVLFLDEPTTGLDPRGRIDVWAAVTDVAERGTTVLLTTQYLDEADQLTSTISIMKDGAIIAEGTPNALKRQRGADRIEVTVATPSDAQKVQHALMPADSLTRDEADTSARPLASAGAPVPHREPESSVVTISAPHGARDLAPVVRRLDDAGLSPDDIALRRPTLDEVFLALTEEETP